MSERRRRPPDSREDELIAMIRAVDVPAPERLHRRTEALIERRARDRRRGGAHSLRPRLGAAAALVAAAVVVLVILASSGGGGSSPFSLRSATALTLDRATQTAPAENTSRRTQLMASVDGIPFPYWEEHFGWRATGERKDSVAGRSITTVFYKDDAGQRVGYAIVAGTPPPRGPAGSLHWRGGTPYRFAHLNGSGVVTWLRHGHLCIVAGRGVREATLLSLASWHERAA
jgi:hypothetical protein